MARFLIAYIPVLHEGYRRLLADDADAPVILLSQEFVAAMDPSCEYLRKDLRALNAETVASAIRAWYPARTVHVATAEMLGTINDAQNAILLPDEEVSRCVIDHHLPWATRRFFPVFLRWDRAKALAQDPVRYERSIPFEGLAAEMLSVAEKESVKATNWWRRVGAVIARDGTILFAGHNIHVPFPYQHFLEGDPRSIFKRGVHIDLTTDAHAESLLIGRASRKGIALEGADLYITTFPCPTCAKLVAEAGIKRCFFTDGYAMLDGERVLRDAGVELIFVEKKSP